MPQTSKPTTPNIMKKTTMISTLLIGWATLLFAQGCQDDKPAPTPFLELAETSLVCTQQAGTYEVGVKTNVAWQASVPSSGGWCTTGGSEDLLVVNVAENTGMESRTTEITLSGSGVEDKLTVQQLGEAPDILLEKERIDLNYGDTLVNIKVLSNVGYDVLIPATAGWITPASEAKATRAMVESARTFCITENTADTVRYASLTFTSVEDDKPVERSLMIRQAYRDKAYNPGDPSGLGDVFIPVSRAEANQENSAEESAAMSIDGTTATWYHSPWYSTTFPVELTYHFDTPQEAAAFLKEIGTRVKMRIPIEKPWILAQPKKH